MAAPLADLVAKGDAKAKERKFAEAAAYFHEAEKLEPNNVAVLLRLSRQYSDLYDLDPKNEAHARTSLRYAEQAVKLDPNNSDAHLSIAIGVGKMTDFVSNKKKMEYSKVVKDKAEKAIQLDPKNHFAWYVLGRWHLGVANVNGVLKLFAKMIYGGLPPASNEEAVRCFKKAEELTPNQLVHHSGLARAYTEMGRKEEARKEWEKVIALTPVDAEEEADVKEGRKVLGK